MYKIYAKPKDFPWGAATQQDDDDGSPNFSMTHSDGERELGPEPGGRAGGDDGADWERQYVVHSGMTLFLLHFATCP